MGTDDKQATAAVTTAVAVTTTGTVKRYATAPGYRVNVRSGPSTQYPIVRALAAGSTVPIHCQKPGEWISGPYGTTNLWDNIAPGEYVSDAYVNTGSDGYVASRCA
ncbi:SH3 domain-containing protein [Streptomyces sp. NBC_00094]|uniref:SH3 domain-containing protein n=1 Tax=Streptomyces sp. NBC_00094 TaxID=2903620 RepID=UPI00224E7F5B|nr:SH3 domain-containing protein [Streptomyces sp. NBC_00094]MCX5391434.1 SH3 domain-containing protein [Streptomyces sp. NBC_00094]